MRIAHLRRVTTWLAVIFAAILSLSSVATAQEAWFEVDAVNAGLSEPGPEVDRRTPRAALQTFLQAADAGAWDRAAHVLDLGDLSPEDQAQQGAILAAQLHSLLDRKAVLDWTAFNGRPDGLQVVGGQNQAQAGEPRRSLLLRDLDLSPVPASIRLNRVKAGEDGDPVWLFDRGTVADLPALYARYGPSEFEKLLPEWMRADAFWGLMWWEMLGLPLLVLSAIALAWATKSVLDRLSHVVTNDLACRLLKAVRTPLMLAAVTALVSWVTGQVFVFSGNIDIILAPTIATGYVVTILLLIVNMVEAALDHLIAPGDDIDLTASENDRSRQMATKLNATKRVLVVLVSLIGAGVVLSTADVFRGLGLSLLASASALTLVLGFAARKVLGNIMASLQIAMNQSARVGDSVVYKGELCHVERINMTFVQLRDWDNTRVVVPVEEFANETFSNWTLEEPAMLRILKFKLAPEADIDALREAFMDILHDMAQSDSGAQLGDLDQAGVNVAGQDVFGIDVWFSTPCSDPNTSWEVACTVRERLVARAAEFEKAHDVTIFPEATPAEAA
jgi:small-conductance mechanosensitive channel